jgi:Na+/melibiose symporter-like transporter
VYRDYLAPSEVFVGLYGQRYGQAPPGADISGLEEEFDLSARLPKLADTNLALMAVLIVAGALILAGFFAWIRRRERAGKEAPLSTGLFRNRTSNLALVTQNVQWAVLLGTLFVVAAYLQVMLKDNDVQTGVIFTAATVGILLSALAAGPLARRFQQRTLIVAGFVMTIAGIIVLLVMMKGHPGAWYFAPGLFLIGRDRGHHPGDRAASRSPRSRTQSPPWPW